MQFVRICSFTSQFGDLTLARHARGATVQLGCYGDGLGVLGVQHEGVPLLEVVHAAEDDAELPRLEQAVREGCVPGVVLRHKAREHTQQAHVLLPRPRPPLLRLAVI